jgi:hypothetical protein
MPSRYSYDLRSNNNNNKLELPLPNTNAMGHAMASAIEELQCGNVELFMIKESHTYMSCLSYIYVVLHVHV